MKRIYLIGITGVGKSTFGQTLANVINFGFHDLDECAANRSQMSISDYFEIHGEAEFRALEHECLMMTEKLTHTVIACGGGIVEREDNQEWLKKQDVVIYLHRGLEGIVADLDARHRPLIKGHPEMLYTLNARRDPLYRLVSKFSVDNGSVTEGLRAVIAFLKEEGVLS